MRVRSAGAGGDELALTFLLLYANYSVKCQLHI